MVAAGWNSRKSYAAGPSRGPRLSPCMYCQWADGTNYVSNEITTLLSVLCNDYNKIWCSVQKQVMVVVPCKTCPKIWC
jgi:hypothetical protein